MLPISTTYRKPRFIRVCGVLLKVIFALSMIASAVLVYQMSQDPAGYQFHTGKNVYLKTIIKILVPVLILNIAFYVFEGRYIAYQHRKDTREGRRSG